MRSTLPVNRKHSHIFDEGNPLAERNTLWAVVLTALVMVAEITGGWMFNSMALLADGWHMSSHALALGLSVLAYQSVTRLIAPRPIQYDQAILLAVVGLLVNLACAWLLKEGHSSHRHVHEQGGDHAHHHDLNLRSAYLHVLADAATSVVAIVALTGGKFWGANWLDPVMGIVGAGLVAAWAYGLLRDTGRILLDAEMNAPIVAEILEVIEQGPVKVEVADLHVWRVGKGKYACILSLVATGDVKPDFFKDRLRIHEELVHVTVEINRQQSTDRAEP